MMSWTRSQPVQYDPLRRISIPSYLFFLILVASGVGAPVRGQPTNSEYFSALRARSIGPAGMGGRIAAIDAVGADPNIVFVGAATGGLWKSVNGGQTWEPTFDGERLLGIGAVAVFQANPEIVWVGTGEGAPGSSTGVGAGVYRSMDGGLTWKHLGLQRSERVHRILLHPSDPDIAYAGIMGPDGRDGEERGVYRTTDGGDTWERILYVDEGTGAWDLAMDPSNPDKLFATMWESRRGAGSRRSRGSGSGLYITYDGGDRWRRLSGENGLPTGAPGRMGLAIARNDPDVVYVLVEGPETALLLSDDGGNRWRTVPSKQALGNQSFTDTDISVDPENELRIYHLGSRLMLSEDGGRRFRDTARGVRSGFHALWIDPADPRLLYAGTDGGVYVSRDRGGHWRMIDNLPVGQFSHVSVDMGIPFNVYGGMQNNGSWRGPSDVWEAGGIRNHHWEVVGSGDGAGTLPDPSDSTLGYSMSPGGALVRFDMRTGERRNIRPWAPDTVRLRFNRNAGIARDPFDPATLYYGSQFVHKTRNRGDTWEIISPDLTTNDPERQEQDRAGALEGDATGAEDHSTILSIAPSPVERELIWVGTDDGRVHLSRSGGGHWEDVGRRIRGVPDGTGVPHIEASKNHAGTAYVVFDDHRRGNWAPYIYRTENYGRDWRNIADDDQIRGFVHTLEEDPLTSNLLFAGTEFGLYVSLNRGEDWSLWTHGLPPVPIRSLTIHPRDHDLVIGTYGRAIYVLDDIRPLRALAQDPSLADLPVHLFDTPPAYLRSGGPPDDYPMTGDAAFQGDSRPYGALLTYSVGMGVVGENDSVEIEVLDSTGEVVRTLKEPGRPGLNRVSWDLREDPPDEEIHGAVDGDQGISGLEVFPGLYTVRITVANGAAEAPLEVLPDPRTEILMSDRVLKRDAVRLGMELLATGQAVRDRREEIEGAVEGVLERLVGRDYEEADRMREVGGEIVRGLAHVADLLREMDRNRRDVLSMAAAQDAPTEAERIALRRLEEGLEEAMVEINGLLVTRVADFRALVKAAGMGRLPEYRVVIRQRKR